MGNIYKGTIAGIEGNTARVLPSDAGAKPTAKIVIPWHLRGSTGNLTKGTPVVYVEFETPAGYYSAGPTVSGALTFPD